MINIPVNDPAALPSAKKTDAKRRDKLVVSRLLSGGGMDAGPCVSEGDDRPEAEPHEVPCDARVEPDIFNFNGESVVAASDPDKPYALYRRVYPHKPKWIVADSTHRVICMCLWRSHAQATVDELNALAAGR